MYKMLTDRSEVEVDNIFANVTVENNFDLDELERQVNTLWI
jgi:TATA-box binding protein (TBP) (component of TFIID and TFIIIB)